MSARLLIRKNSGDPHYPWTLIDAECPSREQHDFSGHDFADSCNGNCDAFATFNAAIWFAGLVDA
jgi:hypothetical protein